jgi:hypothetical protein
MLGKTLSFFKTDPDWMQDVWSDHGYCLSQQMDSGCNL